ncbi:MAG: helix-turn-helix domain-containing protein [Solirubrobacteraceae bacterium]|nr:helix-turn-helix domain-containing protein [Patulibacter sp.]
MTDATTEITDATVSGAPPDDCPAAPKMRADARRNRARIIEAAREVFAKTGSLTQMDDVAAAAGVGVGTVYRHFPTKDQLMGELLLQKFEVILRLLREARELDGDPGERLLESLTRCAEEFQHDTATQQIMSGPQSAAVWDSAAPTVREVDAVSEELIAAGQKTGTLRADMTVMDIRLLMCGLASSMADPDLNPAWRRHMTLITDSLRPPARGV